MESLETIRAFLGWSIVVHFVVMIVMFAVVMAGGKAVRGVHARMFDLTEQDLGRAYFQFFAQYKTGVWLLAIVPWIALHLIDRAR